MRTTSHAVMSRKRMMIARRKMSIGRCAAFQCELKKTNDAQTVRMKPKQAIAVAALGSPSLLVLLIRTPNETRKVDTAIQEVNVPVLKKSLRVSALTLCHNSSALASR